MAIQLAGSSGDVVEAGVRAYNSGAPLHTQVKPLPYGSLGHYRTTHRCALIAAQAANSRLFELQNSHASNLIVITRLQIKWMQTAPHTAAIEDSLDVFKVTSFSAVDTTNTVTPTVSRKRTSMATAPGAANVRGVTVAGAAAGMTGGTLTKDGAPWAQFPKWLLLAQPTAGPVDPSVMDTMSDDYGSHPWVFAQNEGFEIENRVLLGAAAGSSVYIECGWAEVALY